MNGGWEVGTYRLRPASRNSLMPWDAEKAATPTWSWTALIPSTASLRPGPGRIPTLVNVITDFRGSPGSALAVRTAERASVTG
jgi:hypothetical protein